MFACGCGYLHACLGAYVCVRDVCGCLLAYVDVFVRVWILACARVCVDACVWVWIFGCVFECLHAPV